MLTAIVPITNMAGKLQKLESWLPMAVECQIEVKIVHDIRDSNTQTELESLVEGLDSSRITLYSGVFGSPGAARNHGIANSNSTFVTFWDADDLPHPKQILSELIKFENHFDILIGQYLVRKFPNENSNARTSKDSNLDAVGFNPGLWRMVFRKEFISTIIFTDLRMGEDQFFLAECLRSRPRITFSNAKFYEYFVGVDGQLTTKKSIRSDLLEIFSKLITLRSTSTKMEYRFLSIVIIRMWFTLLKSGITGAIRIKELKILITRRILFTKHPLQNIAAFFYIFLRFLEIRTR